MKRHGSALPASAGSVDTTAIALGLPGFVVLAGAEYGGELELLIETTASTTGCPRCVVVATLHDRQPRWVRDLPAGGRPVVLVWLKRVWRCDEPRCEQRTWSETSPAIRRRAVLTERARVEACRRVGQDAHAVAQVAADLGVGWGTVMRAVREYGQRLLDSQWLHTNVTVLGLDETALLAATATGSTRFVTGLVDLRPAGGGPARLLDVVEGRSGSVVSDRLADRGDDWCARVQVAALDPFRGYEVALRSALTSATVVLDPFHAVRLAQNTLDQVRRRVQQQTLGHRGHKHDPLYRIRRLLRRGAETLTEKAYRRLLAGLDAGDPDGQVAAAWIACQELRHVYGAPDLGRARRRLERFLLGLRLSRRPRAATARRHHLQLGSPAAGPFHYRRHLQRPHRSREPAHQADQARRLRLPQLRQPPPPPTAALRRHLAHSPHHTDPGPVTTLHVVEPDFWTGAWPSV